MCLLLIGYVCWCTICNMHKNYEPPNCQSFMISWLSKRKQQCLNFNVTKELWHGWVVFERIDHFVKSFQIFLKNLQLNSLHFLCFMIFQFILYITHLFKLLSLVSYFRTEPATDKI